MKISGDLTFRRENLPILQLVRIDCPEKEGGIVPFQVNDWMYDIKFCVGLSENLQRCNEMAGFSTSKRSSLGISCCFLCACATDTRCFE